MAIIEIQDDALKAIWLLAEQQGITVDEALRRAIATEGFVKTHLANGRKFFTLAEDGNIQEVEFVGITKEDLQ